MASALTHPGISLLPARFIPVMLTWSAEDSLIDYAGHTLLVSLALLQEKQNTFRLFQNHLDATSAVTLLGSRQHRQIRASNCAAGFGCDFHTPSGEGGFHNTAELWRAVLSPYIVGDRAPGP